MEDLTDSVASDDLSKIWGSATNVSGKIDNCYSFDGNDRIGRADMDSITGDGSYSFSYWGFLATGYGSNSSFVYVRETGGDGDHVFHTFINGTTGDMICRSYTSAGWMQTSPLASIPLDTWFHYVCTQDGTTMRSYLNASAVGTKALSGAYATATYQMNLGALENNSYPLTGKIDELGIWSRALTTTEITALYNSGDGMSYADITGGGGWANTINGVNTPSGVDAVKDITSVNGVI